ncbi:hypothetical protein M8J76_000680 [Diaphorina citri]|nr:hypothetical protein M8J76_000680 [Diaphorina citri]
MEVLISLFINRVSAVEESKEEISLDVFLQLYWTDERITIDNTSLIDQVELTWEKDHAFWIPDLYIRQLREMRVLALFQDMAATVIIKCDMDFSLYPLDVQTCYVDFSSYKYTVSDMHFRWRDDPPLNFPRDSGDIYRLPRYVVSFATEKVNRTIYYGEGNHSAARMIITLSREIRSHLVESYLPSTLFVIMSWGSFVVMPEIVPGRMVLLVTTLLSLVTMFDTIRNNSPSALELKCIEVWLISCTCFVFLAMLEYFIVLFGIRYDKHWRHKHRDLDHLVSRTASISQAATRVFGGVGPKVSPQESRAVIQKDNAPPTNNTSNDEHNNVADHNIEGGGNVAAGNNITARKKFQMLTRHVILYCGHQRGMLDQVSLALFPLCFVLFATIYWVSYLNASKMKKEMQPE